MIAPQQWTRTNTKGEGALATTAGKPTRRAGHGKYNSVGFVTAGLVDMVGRTSARGAGREGGTRMTRMTRIDADKKRNGLGSASIRVPSSLPPRIFSLAPPHRPAPRRK